MLTERMRPSDIAEYLCDSGLINREESDRREDEGQSKKGRWKHPALL
jgi:hypothetical protein